MGFTSWFRALLGSGSSDRPEPVDLDDFESMTDALDACGFSSVADVVRAEIRQAIILDAPGPGSATAGFTKIGGQPDLSPDLDWPACDGRSLAFIAQVDLAQIAAVWPDGPLPGSGILSFFYDAEQSVWGFDPKDKGNWSVILSANDNLRTREFPVDLPEDARFAERRLEPARVESTPDPFCLDLENLGLSGRDTNELLDICDPFLPADETIHKMFGHADAVQGPMETECQLVFNGLYCGDQSGYSDPQAEALSADAHQWRLLLQVSTDDEAGMMWGDCGRIYFWIRDQDLRAADFDKTWLILQCS